MKCVSSALFFIGCVAVAAADAPPPAPPSAPAPLAKWEEGDASLIPRAFQSNPHLDVMIVTELTANGRKAPVASRGETGLLLG